MPLNIDKIRKLMGDRPAYAVALASGVERKTVLRILAQQFDPKLSTVEKLAVGLGCPAKDLLD